MSHTHHTQLPIGREFPWLAPLAGFSDLPFRLLCREMGCAVACTEMISAKGLIFRSPGTTDLLRTCSDDHPLVVQLFGSEREVIAEALTWLIEQGYQYFDLNAGCPVKKVVKTGAGAGLLQKPDHLLKIVSSMVDIAGPGRVGVKLRSGWACGQDVMAWIKELDFLGLGWVSLHPRTAKQGYAGWADWKVLSVASRELNIPVLASGDLFTAGDGLQCMQETGVSGVMFARGALADPGIFATYLQILRGEEDEAHGPHEGRQRALGMARRHIALMHMYGKGDRDLFRMRTIIPRYLRGFARVKNIRKQVVACTTWPDLLKCLDDVEVEL